MTPDPVAFFACPMCNAVHSPGGSVSRIANFDDRNVFSDFANEIYPNAPQFPVYAVCHQCGVVRPVVDFKKIVHSGSEKLPKLVAATREQLWAALKSEPFCSDFYHGQNLRLHLLREENKRLAAGLPVLDAALRQQLVEILYMECHKLSSTPLYLHITGEIERQRSVFEQARQRSLDLINQKEDSHQPVPEFQWSTQTLLRPQRPSMQQEPEAETRPAFTARKGLKYLLVASQNESVGENIAQWTHFPEMLAVVEKLGNLTTMARMYDPVAGIVLVTREVQLAYPTEDHFDKLLATDFCFVKDVPILLIADSICGEKYNIALRDALRMESFHIAAIDESALNFERLSRWKMTHSRRAERRVRSLLKFQTGCRQ